MLRPDPGLGDQFAQGSVNAGGSLTLDQTCRVRPGDEYEVMVEGQALLADAPESLAQRPLDGVALDRTADLLADRDPEALCWSSPAGTGASAERGKV